MVTAEILPFPLVTDPKGSESSTQQVASAAHRRFNSMVFPAGHEIYAQGERAGAHFRVLSGAVRIYRLLSDGRRQISGFCLSGEIFGFEADDTHHFFAETLCPTRLCPVPINLHSTSSSDDLFASAVRALVRAQEHLLLLGRQDASQRMAAFFLEMLDRQGGEGQIELLMSRNDIADYLGLSLETVSRVISRLKCDGVIKLTSIRCVEIVRRKYLEQLAA